MVTIENNRLVIVSNVPADNEELEARKEALICALQNLPQNLQKNPQYYLLEMLGDMVLSPV